VGETLTQEDYEIRDNVIPTTDCGDNPKIDDITDVGNIMDQVLQSLNEKIPETDAGNNAETSGTLEDVVEDFVPTTPVDNTVSNQL
ncbi:hypothetical protein A2U01_0085880, partial [Trifolium medium]|nr:hypothetical protein [Trifolium medium]